MSSEESEEPDLSDPSVSNEQIGRWLREQPLDVRKEWIIRYIGNPLGAFDVAKRAGFLPSEARALVESTVDRADASTIRWWIEFYSNVAGLRKTLRMIEQWAKEGHRERAGMAAYWVGSVTQAKTEAGKKVLAEERERRRQKRTATSPDRT